MTIESIDSSPSVAASQFAMTSAMTSGMTTETPPVSRRLVLASLGGFAAALLSACASGPSYRAAAPGDAWPAPDDAAADSPGNLPDELAREAAFLALSLVDTPYRYGGNTPDSGFDCSGLIVYVFREAASHPLPRTVRQIAQAGQPVRYRTVRTGDIVLFDTAGRFSHAGIYVGNGRFVHAPSTGGVVRLDGVHARYWRPRFSGVRRV